MSERVEFWRGVVGRQGRSGRSVRDFCRREGVSTASFYNWRRRLGERPAIVAAEPRGGRGRGGPRPAFVAVNVRPTAGAAADLSGAACIEIVLPGDVTVRVSDGVSRQTLVDVLAAVREASA
jgi:hypothetical protein